MHQLVIDVSISSSLLLSPLLRTILSTYNSGVHRAGAVYEPHMNFLRAVLESVPLYIAKAELFCHVG